MVDAEEARAMFELRLELHQLALGLRPNISNDEMVELRALMEAGDLEGLLERVLAPPPRQKAQAKQAR